MSYEKPVLTRNLPPRLWMLAAKLYGRYMLRRLLKNQIRR